jgi:NAD(P)-dependent dehydrogenase (short-subunit alcohol dehydrogenase family)
MGILKHKVAFITGASSGIGAGTAKRFAEEGAKVVLADMHAERGKQLQIDLENQGHEAIFLDCDVTQPQAVKAAVEAGIARFGRLDIVFANAGINGVWAPLDELQPNEWDQTLNTNLKGTYLTVHYAVPHLKAASGGEHHHHIQRKRQPVFFQRGCQCLLHVQSRPGRLHEDGRGRTGPP